MRTGMWRTIAATALFGAVHSALASRCAKRLAGKVLGERNRRGFYRLFFNGQALVTSAALAEFVRRQPDDELYHLREPLAWLLRGAQAAALADAAWAVSQVGLGHFSGLESAAAWRRGDEPLPEPEAQGPAPAADGSMQASGPFARSRHPLNFSPLVALWLNPRMTTNLLAFNLAATVYLVVGSLHEEARLRTAYGNAYRDYQQSGVPFYLPRLMHGRRSLTPETAARQPATGRQITPAS